MRDYGLDGGDSSVASPDLQKNATAAQTAGSITSKDSYSITIENLPVKLTGKYNFVFQYYYKNPDETQSTPILGPISATYSVSPTIEDLSTAPTNVVATGGFYSYQLKWDTPTFVSYGDTIVYESDTNSFSSSSKVVYVGTANQCTILTSDLLPKYVYVVHRDMFLDANKKGTVAGPITIQDPITVDSNPPTNNFSVGTTTVQDDPDGLFTFNKKVLFTWTANTDTSTYGYQIRFRRVGTTDYTYMSVPGRTTTSTYLYGLKAGQTYEIGVSTYDQFGNINTSDWKTYPNIVIPASTSLQADVAITAGDMKLGYGIGGDNANKGLYLGPENYWYIQGNTTSSSAARLSVGGTSDKLVWDGSNLSVTGNLTARAGTFTGNILMATSNASIYNGTINAAGNLTGNGFALNSSGLKVANGTNSVTIDAANGRIIANAGTIGGWSLTDSLLNQNNARLSSTGYIELGGANTDNIIRLDANHADYRLWIGRNSATTAPFRVTKEGVLYASGAVISGNSQFSGTISVSSTLSDGGTIGDVKTTASQALPSTTFSKGEILKKINNNTNSTSIEGGILKTGTVVADNLVSGYIYTGELDVGSGTFKVAADGGLTATSATVTGVINANSGRIGDATNGWTFDSSGNLTNGTAGSISSTTLFPKANNTSIGIVGNSNNLSYFSNRGIMVYPGTGSAFGYTAIGSGFVTYSGTSPHISSNSAVRINDAFAPNSDNTYSLGFTDARWQIVRSAGGVSTTSDQRVKTEIKDSILGLNFIKILRPVSYRFISGGKVYKDGAQKEIVDGVIVEPELVDKPGIRTHWGLLAQNVKEAVDTLGIEDFAGWQLDDKNDPNSGQSLVHHEFIGPIIKAVQELSDMVELLQQEINTLKGI